MEPKRIELTYDMIKQYVVSKESLYTPYVWVFYEDDLCDSLNGILYSIDNKGNYKIIGKKMYKNWEEFLTLKDYEYADYVYVYKKDNKWYWMDTCKELELKELEDESK